MRNSLSMVIGGAVFLFSSASFAGDCNKTVMGGGCSGQVQAGVSPHMQSQNPLNAVTKVKANAAAPAAKAAAPAKNVKVSNVAGQKPQI
jgi:hypothetical protein